VPISAGPSLDLAVMSMVYAVSEWLPIGHLFAGVISMHTLKSNAANYRQWKLNWIGYVYCIVRVSILLNTF